MRKPLFVPAILVAALLTLPALTAAMRILFVERNVRMEASWAAVRSFV